MKRNATGDDRTLAYESVHEKSPEGKNRGWSQETAGLAWLAGLNAALLGLLFYLVYKGVQTYAAGGF